MIVVHVIFSGKKKKKTKDIARPRNKFSTPYIFRIIFHNFIRKINPKVFPSPPSPASGDETSSTLQKRHKKLPADAAINLGCIYHYTDSYSAQFCPQ